MGEKKLIKKEIYKTLVKYLPKKSGLYGLFGIKVAFVIIGCITPIFYKTFVDEVLVNQKYNLMLIIALGYITLYLIESLLLAIEQSISNRNYAKFLFNLRYKIMNKILHMSTKKYETYTAGDLSTRIMNDTEVCKNFFDNHIINYYFNFISAIVYSCILVGINYKLALFALIMIPFSTLFTKVVAKSSIRFSSEYREQWGEYEDFLFKAIQGWREVKSLNQYSTQKEKFVRYKEVLGKLFVKQHVYWYINRAFIAFKDMFITKMNLYFIGGLLIFKNELSIGSLLVFMVYYESLFENISQVNDLNITLAQEIPSIKKVKEILEQPQVMTGNKISFNESIKLENVTFGYDERLVIKNLNLEIKKNKYIAIVGKSGCGKSTLIKLLMQLYRPWTGKIKIDDWDIQELASESYHELMSIVMQEPYLFNLSIRENLELIRPNLSREEMEDACKKAQIYDFINSQPEQFETVIGEKGIKLSGGQKQRLAIARIFLQQHPIIILDEATSALDYETEERLNNVIALLKADKTIIVVAHRLSTILAADEIILMQDGKIIEHGTHEEMQKGKWYNELFKEQYIKTS